MLEIVFDSKKPAGTHFLIARIVFAMKNDRTKQAMYKARFMVHRHPHRDKRMFVPDSPTLLHHSLG